MPVKERKREILIEKRAHALALMLLTRGADLLIEEVQDDIGLDVIVRFHSEGKEGLREFGIQVKGLVSAETKDHADKALRASIQQTQRYGPSLRPVCLFLFAMENDGGWYTWIAEPIEEDGKPLLRSCAEPDCRQLDKRALKEIIERVNVWYDAIYASVIVNGSGGRKARKERSGEI